MIGIIKYGAGNIYSVISAVKYIGKKAILITKPEDISKIEILILPGVGNFSSGMEYLINTGLDRKIKESIKNGMPFLGICLGLQLLFEGSEEGEKEGFEIFKGKVVKFKNNNIKIPHMGWNKVKFVRKSKLFDKIENNSYFYFAHSYYAETLKDLVFGTTEYGITFPSIIVSKNIVGVQFHPEKSGKVGLLFLKNFLEGKWLQ